MPIDPVGELGLVMWQPGQTMVHHEYWNDRIRAARPLIMVATNPPRPGEQTEEPTTFSSKHLPMIHHTMNCSRANEPL